MSKAFTRESSEADESEGDDSGPALPTGLKNYMTPAGHARMQAEFAHLVKVERPEVVRVVAWAASNGDRSENGDYLYGKKRLRELDRRIRFLTKRLENVQVVDPRDQDQKECVFFGATVTVYDEAQGEQTYSIVGLDEADPSRGRISWISPLAKALLKARLGDVVRLQTPGGVRELEILAVAYRVLD